MRLKLAVALLSLISALAYRAEAQGPAYPYAVNLSFSASTSTNVIGYNMYRSPYASGACGSFTKVNAALFSATSYADKNPPEGFYCYGATAVNSSNVESGLSNLDQNIAIPPPPPTGLGATVSTTRTTDNVTFAWNQSPGRVTANEVYCSPSASKPMQEQWKGGPATKVTISVPKSTKGLFPCEVTAWGAEGQSAPSNVITVNIP